MLKKFWRWLTWKKEPSSFIPIKDPAPPVVPPVTNEPKRYDNPAYIEAKKYDGKKETDKAFAAWLSTYWKKTGLNYKQIAGTSFAWCALIIVAVQSDVGQDYVASAAAIKQRKTGIEIKWKEDGIPRGAIVGINHKGDCSSSSNNHVAFSDGDCAVKDLFESNGKLKKGVTIKLYGGNQDDRMKTSSYDTFKICAVRWPSEVPKPGKILKSVNCAGAKDNNESTR